jgi:NADPH2:quinone reductase
MAIGVNPVDIYIRSGWYLGSKLPYVPGLDASGIIIEKGSKITDFNVGDRVYCFKSISGTYAKKIIAKQGQFFKLPDNLSFEEGAALGTPYGAAYRALFHKGHAKSGQKVLIHGGSGNVGLAAIKLAKNINMIVVATAGSEEGKKLCREAGADLVVDHNIENFKEEIFKFTEDGFDLIIEMSAHNNLKADLDFITMYSAIVIVGSKGEVLINPRNLMSKDARIMGFVLFNAKKDELLDIHSNLYDLFISKKLRPPVVGKTFNLKDAKEAHVLVEKGAYGKIILKPDS